MAGYLYTPLSVAVDYIIVVVGLLLLLLTIILNYYIEDVDLSNNSIKQSRVLKCLIMTLQFAPILLLTFLSVLSN